MSEDINPITPWLRNWCPRINVLIVSDEIQRNPTEKLSWNIAMYATIIISSYWVNMLSHNLKPIIYYYVVLVHSILSKQSCFSIYISSIVPIYRDRDWQHIRYYNICDHRLSNVPTWSHDNKYAGFNILWSINWL